MTTILWGWRWTATRWWATAWFRTKTRRCRRLPLFLGVLLAACLLAPVRFGPHLLPLFWLFRRWLTALLTLILPDFALGGALTSSVVVFLVRWFVRSALLNWSSPTHWWTQILLMSNNSMLLPLHVEIRLRREHNRAHSMPVRARAGSRLILLCRLLMMLTMNTSCGGPSFVMVFVMSWRKTITTTMSIMVVRGMMRLCLLLRDLIINVIFQDEVIWREVSVRGWGEAVNVWSGVVVVVIRGVVVSIVIKDEIVH